MGVRVRRTPEGFDQIPCDEGEDDHSHHLKQGFNKVTFEGLTFGGFIVFKHNRMK